MAVENYLLGRAPSRALPAFSRSMLTHPWTSYDERQVAVFSWQRRLNCVPPPPQSVCSEGSVSTVRDYGDHDYQSGEWTQ